VQSSSKQANSVLADGCCLTVRHLLQTQNTQTLLARYTMFGNCFGPWAGKTWYIGKVVSFFRFLKGCFKILTVLKVFLDFCLKERRDRHFKTQEEDSSIDRLRHVTSFFLIE